jgi:hypothetical protein
MIAEWAFVLVLSLADSAVDIRAVTTAKTFAECDAFRNKALSFLGAKGRGSLKTEPTPAGGLTWAGGSMTKCEPTEPIK